MKDTNTLREIYLIIGTFISILISIFLYGYYKTEIYIASIPILMWIVSYELGKDKQLDAKTGENVK